MNVKIIEKHWKIFDTFDLFCFESGATLRTISDHISNTQYLKYNLDRTQRYSQSCIIRNQTHISRDNEKRPSSYVTNVKMIC